jgi:YidC/Oxa1 family membrane protein insertase
MEMYKKEKVNPLGGCLPMLIQLPLLWAMFALLQDGKSEIARLIKDSDFFFFGLSVKLGATHNYVLAIISGITTFIQSKMTTPATGNDPSQQQQQIFLYIMPIMFGYFTWMYSVAIGLYWVASNVIGIIQQYLIYEYFIVKEHIQKEGETQDTSEKKNEITKK